ncbi:MAG TPA: hypothetical protein VGA00_10105 [Acidiferrobacterales bacterium]
MGFGRRLLVTVAAMFLASFVAGTLWRMAFGTGMPSYLAGVVGGLAALPVWELMRRRGR